MESRLNTPLFVGFPGFVSELWLAADGRGVYRGIYEWDGPPLAGAYARALWRVLAFGERAGLDSLPRDTRSCRDHVLADPAILNGVCPDRPGRWWRVIGTN